MPGGLGGCHVDGRDPLRTVGVCLECRFPEMLGRLVVACEEGDCRHLWTGREGEAEGDGDTGAVWERRLALEIEGAVVADAGLCERRRVGAAVAAGENQHRDAFARLEELPVVRAETEAAGRCREVMRRERIGTVHLQQLDEVAAGELRQPVRCAHLGVMLRARRQRETERFVAPRGRIEVANGEHDMIDPSTGRHGLQRYSPTSCRVRPQPCASATTRSTSSSSMKPSATSRSAAALIAAT